LPFLHRDPFDRLLIATAIEESMTLLSADESIHKYDMVVDMVMEQSPWAKRFVILLADRMKNI
jgi:PIN domain nuclease of toxin-antitoxin system